MHKKISANHESPDFLELRVSPLAHVQHYIASPLLPKSQINNEIDSTFFKKINIKS